MNQVFLIFYKNAKYFFKLYKILDTEMFKVVKYFINGGGGGGENTKSKINKHRMYLIEI